MMFRLASSLLTLMMTMLLSSCQFASYVNGFAIMTNHQQPKTTIIPIASQRRNLVLFVSTENDQDDIPTMDWLTDGLKKESADSIDGDDDGTQYSEADMTKAKTYMEEHEGRSGDLGDVPIPTTGVSVADEMVNANRDRFYTELVHIKNPLAKRGIQAAQIITTSTSGSFEPLRYIVGISKQEKPTTAATQKNDSEDEDENDSKPTQTNSYVMIDVPPYSKQLAQSIQEFIGPNGKLDAILLTCRDCIHYDDAPGVFTIRKADLRHWTKAFPDINVVGYRLDIPRDCREFVTQRLDGYGPFALQDQSDKGSNFTFVESGRPLTVNEWDYDVMQDVMAGKRAPPDDDVSEDDESNDDEKDLYTPEAIHNREEGKQILAVYTPGRTYGSVCYVFPDIKLCASGFTVPIEDSRHDTNYGSFDNTGPPLDCRGFITTSRAGITKQMESARDLISNYVDRFNVLLPASQSDPFFIEGNTEQRSKELMEIINQYERIGDIYEQLGITGGGDGH